MDNYIRLHICNKKYHENILKYIKNNNIYNNNTYYYLLYTNEGLLRYDNKSKNIKKLKIKEYEIPTELILKNNENKNIKIECVKYNMGENIYNIADMCYEVKIDEKIYFINQYINYIQEIEYFDNKIITTKNYFTLKNENLTNNIDYLYNLLE